MFDLRDARLLGLSLLLAGALAGAQTLQAQPVFKEPDQPDLADLIADMARELGEAIGAREQLQAERRARIADLEAKLAACGSCAQRATLEAELNRWRATDKALAEAERAALAAVGLSQYGSVDEMKAGLAAGLAQWSAELEAKRQKDADFGRAQTAINLHCQAQVLRDIPAHCIDRMSSSSRQLLSRRADACSKQFHAGLVFTNDLTVRELCRKTRKPDACVQQNSLLARLGEEGKQALAEKRRERREAGVDPRPLRDRTPSREELAQRRADEQERRERLQAATTPEEKQRIYAEYAQRSREAQAVRQAARQEERRQQQACELS